MKQPRFLILGILFLATLLRTIQFPNNPPGFFVDEASAGYEAFSLLRTGADSWNVRLPVYFTYAGTGQNVLYSYLSILSISIFGLSRFAMRCMNLFLGILTVPLLYVTVKRTLGLRAALLSAFGLAILPWHIMLSRWGLDSSPLPFFLLLGTYTIARALSATRARLWTILALAPWALSLYGYIVATIVVPILLALIFLSYRDRISRHWLVWLAAVIVFCFILFPMGLFLYKNLVSPNDWAIERSLPFGIPTLPFSRLAVVTSPLPMRLEANFDFVVSGFHNEIDIHDAVPDHASMFLVALPLALIGTWHLVRRIHKAGQGNLFLFWLASSLPLVVLFNPAIHRVNAILVPILVVAAHGFAELSHALETSRRARRIFHLGVGVLIAVQSGLFLFDYFFVYPVDPKTVEEFYTNFDRALYKGIEIAGVGEPILVTNAIPYPNTLAAFFTEYPPEKYQHEFKSNDRFGDLTIESFGRFFFSPAYLPKERSSFVYVLSKRDENPCTDPHQVLETRLWKVGRCEAR